MHDRVRDFPQFIAEAGDDTDSEEYVVRDGEETLDDDWHMDHPPECTYLWKNGAEFSIFPSDPVPTSFAAFGRMLVQTMTWANVMHPVVDHESESKLESKSGFPIPEHVARLEPKPASVPADPTKAFGYGCPSFGQACKNRPGWWSDWWDMLSGVLGPIEGRFPVPVDADKDRKYQCPMQTAILRSKHRFVLMKMRLVPRSSEFLKMIHHLRVRQRREFCLRQWRL
jgi:hypothetical protein